ITSTTNHKKIKVVRKSKSSKKVRSAVELEEFFINKVVDEPLETKIHDRSQMKMMIGKVLKRVIRIGSMVLAVDYYHKNDDKLLSLESDAQMEFYGLHKVATEGPCQEDQPMALKVSVRAKWDT
nr:FERM/acyl-CoA-binding protein, 3-helical bundle [Tanacetum cinerariifolium]